MSGLHIPGFPDRPEGRPAGLAAGARTLAATASRLGEQQAAAAQTSKQLVGLDRWDSDGARRFTGASESRSAEVGRLVASMQVGSAALRVYADDLGQAQQRWDRARQGFDHRVAEAKHHEALVIATGGLFLAAEWTVGFGEFVLEGRRARHDADDAGQRAATALHRATEGLAGTFKSLRGLIGIAAKVSGALRNGHYRVPVIDDGTYRKEMGSIPPPRKYENDGWGLYKGECTSFVAFALRANGQGWALGSPTSPGPLYHGGQMDAYQWLGHARSAGNGITTGDVAKVRAVAVWPERTRGDGGHVAYVTAVDPVTGEFTVAEYNAVPPFGHTLSTTRRFTAADIKRQGIQFIYIPSRP